MQEAIERYCDVMIGISRTALEARRHTIRRNLRIGVLILAISLGVGAGLANAEFLSPGLRGLLANAVSILGTVALWTPVDNLLFGLPPLARAVRIYEAIKALAIELRFTQDQSRMLLLNAESRDRPITALPMRP
ncbi:MAG: hypothetical protein IPK19_36130 [Chloroflexi bacterium]|nr:hypothetical protein [Chloroflexota bacterium]